MDTNKSTQSFDETTMEHDRSLSSSVVEILDATDDTADWIRKLEKVFANLDDWYEGNPPNSEQIAKHVIDKKPTHERLVLSISRNLQEGSPYYRVTLNILGETEAAPSSQRTVFSSHITSIQIEENRANGTFPFYARFISKNGRENPDFQMLLAPTGSYQISSDWAE